MDHRRLRKSGGRTTAEVRHHAGDISRGIPRHLANHGQRCGTTVSRESIHCPKEGAAITGSNQRPRLARVWLAMGDAVLQTSD